MKYLIQFKKESFITILVFATIFVVLVWAIWAIAHSQFSMENLLSIFGAIIEFFGWYYNMPTSEENAIFTKGMRAAKKEPEVEDELPFDYFESEGDEDVK